MKIIGFTGAAGAGKDTACGFALEWCKENGLAAERVAFADPLKVSAARALGFQGASALGSPEETAECVAFCNQIKQADVTIHVSLFHPANTGPDPQPPEYEPLAELSGRQYLQFYGTEAHRDVFGESFWSDALLTVLKGKEQEGVDVVFITDVRFENEGSLIAGLGEIWSVNRELEQTVEAHASEEPLPSELIEFDIDNSGDLKDLRALIGSVCEHNLKEAT
jgi:hypothetical protein